jgi:beta-phosphoglucomutase
MTIEAVIFDFDGVIGDTMHDNFRAWEKAFSDYDTKIDAIDYFLMEGMGRYEIADAFVEKNGLKKELVNTLVQKKEDNYKRENNFSIYKEIPVLLNFLSEHKIKIGLVTGASRDRIEHTLGAELKKHFSIIVTSDEVTNCKPHPEPYLKAIEKLSCDPKKSIVIENAKLGIISAKKAGCICYAVQTTLGKEYLTDADMVFESHKHVLEHFKKL